MVWKIFSPPSCENAAVWQRKFSVQAKICRSILEYWIEIGIDGWELTHVEVSDFSLARGSSGRMNLRGSACHPKVDPKRVFIWGTSKGAELALLMASRMPDVIKGVVAVVPSHLMWQGIKEDNSQTSSWSFNGQALPFAPIIFDGQDFYQPPFKLRVGYDRTLNTIPDLSFAEIPVEKIAGPILLVSGTDDQVWPSSTMSDRIVEKLKKNSFPYEVRHLKFENAGHFIGLPAWPTSGRIFGMMAAGGNSDADGIASAESRPQIMRFLKKISEE